MIRCWEPEARSSEEKGLGVDGLARLQRTGYKQTMGTMNPCSERHSHSAMMHSKASFVNHVAAGLLLKHDDVKGPPC